MFEQWSDARTLRVFDPPRAVTVDMTVIDPTLGRGRRFGRSGVSLHVRANGAQINPQLAGWQMAWLGMADGQWRALVYVQISSANGQSRLPVTLWVPPDALTVAATASEDGAVPPAAS
ncbi:hypothetical protein EEB19_22335 [Gordonia sp. OPL2]|nr:hypothetical protein EEB19_22335 [Gordonia sp. OPL2]